MGNYHIIFDNSDIQFDYTWLTLIIPLMLYYLLQKYIYPLLSFKGRYSKGYMMFGKILTYSFFSVLLILTFLLGNSDYFKIKKALDRKSYTTVEGKVEQYNSRMDRGREYESFAVSGVLFKTEKDPPGEAGRSINSKNVRITYIPDKSENLIIKLELKDE